MDYLTITGSLRLRPLVNELTLQSMIEQLNNIAFNHYGVVTIKREGDCLTMDAEGEISLDVGGEIIACLRTLKTLATDCSWIIINRIRWELNIHLMTSGVQDDLLTPVFREFLSSQENAQLILL